LAQSFVIDVDSDLVEKRIDRRPQLGHGAHGGNEILFFDRTPGLGLGHFNRAGQRLLLRLPVELSLRRAGIVAVVLFLFDAGDVGRALSAGEQILAVLTVEKLSQCLDPTHDQQKIVLAFEGKDSVNEIVPCALFAQLHFQTVGEEAKQIDR